MRKVLVFGTFDIIHPGHLNFLKEAKKHGDFLIVVVARDLTVKTIKGSFPDNTEQKRLSDVKKLGIADKILLGNIEDKYKVIEEIRPDVICLGYDQNSFTQNLDVELLKRKVQARTIRLPPYKHERYKSSKIKIQKYK